MVPNVGTNGASFRGAGAYYLHDKPFTTPDGARVEPETSWRVGWTEMRNLLAATPETAIDTMWHTAEAQAELKRAAGVEARGRKCTEPVKTLSLAWHPDETPSREQMGDAADSYLTHMGWAEHQALLVAHTDTAHPHVHIILNRVHPVTGRTLDDFREQIRSQVWALAYEREHGRIRCEARVDKDYAADLIAKRADQVPYTIEKEGRGQEAPFVATTAELGRLDGTERDLLHKRQREEREAFFKSAPDQFRQARRDAFVAVKAEFKAQWKAHFANARMLEAQARELADEDAQRAVTLCRSGKFGEAWAALAGGQAKSSEAAEFDPKKLAADAIAASRAKIGEAQKAVRIERQQAACQSLYDARAQHYLDMKERQRDERAELRSMVQAAARGEQVDLARANFLLNGDKPMPTHAYNTAQLLAQARTANENAAAVDKPAAETSNGNRPPKVQLQTAAVAASNHHIDLLLASARMTRSASMASMQMADMQILARRRERQLAEQRHGGSGPTPAAARSTPAQSETTQPAAPTPEAQTSAPPPSAPAANAAQKAGETSDLMQRILALDTRTPEDKAREAQLGEAAKSRDRGGGRDR